MRGNVLLAVVLLAGASVDRGLAYSVLTHEAIIDAAWEVSLQPLLKARYPDLTAEQLRAAHAFAYGGSIIQDMGYYPFGSKLFSDLVHYVRSGDFVTALLSSAENANEYAFALGALAHYAADNNGHPTAINRTVPLVYPKLRRKFGEIVTYEDDPVAHLKTEFGFDVLEVARGSYAPQAYHDFIGFEVAKPVLARAFESTYGVPLNQVFKDLNLALGTYRHTVSHLIPEMTKVAWHDKKAEIGKAAPGMARSKFVYNLSRASFDKEWGSQYEKPGLGARIMAFFFRMIPKVGPFQALGFRVPPPQGEKLFMDSFNHTLTAYKSYLGEVRSSKIQLPDRNLDTGEPVREGAYHMADRAYGELLEKLADTKAEVPGPLKVKLLAFYQRSEGRLSPKAQAELEALRR